jgi:DNA repair photolyase
MDHPDHGPEQDQDQNPRDGEQVGGFRQPLKGRGAIGNPEGRFEPRTTVPFDDGWGTIETEREAASAPIQTTVTPERHASLRVISSNDSPDVPFEISINPYKGCEHGCIYCFARQTHAFLGLSPGLDFETKIFSKPDAPQHLRRELARRGYRCRVLALGANTDPYQPVERRLRITRGILEVLAEHKHPVSVVTKSDLVLRDLDLLGPMAAERLASVHVSITTLDLELARTMEPRAPVPPRRLGAIRALAEAGVPVGVLASPMIPGLNDAELDRILEAGAKAGATTAGTILVRLPYEVKDLFVEWLKERYPTKAERVLRLLREARGGKLYDSTWGERMRGEGLYAELLRKRFENACRRFGLRTGDGRSVDLDVTRFRVPGRPEQGSLFG